MSVLQSEFAISLITIFYLKTNFILHPYFFAYKKKHIVFFGETYKGRGTVYHRVKIGDEDTITVYRTSKGKYKIEPIDSPIEILIATIGAVLCIFILVAMTVGRILEKRDKEKNEESDNKGKKSKRK